MCSTITLPQYPSSLSLGAAIPIALLKLTPTRSITYKYGAYLKFLLPLLLIFVFPFFKTTSPEDMMLSYGLTFLLRRHFTIDMSSPMTAQKAAGTPTPRPILSFNESVGEVGGDGSEDEDACLGLIEDSKELGGGVKVEGMVEAEVELAAGEARPVACARTIIVVDRAAQPQLVFLASSPGPVSRIYFTQAGEAASVLSKSAISMKSFSEVS